MKQSRLGNALGMMLMLLFIAAFASQCMGESTTPQTQEVAMAEEVQTREGTQFVPTLVPHSEIAQGSKWEITDIWEDQVGRVIDGNEIFYDWGFFMEIGVENPRIILAECIDPFKDLPALGTDYTANPDSPNVLLPPKESMQKFLVINEVTQEEDQTPTPTMSIPPTPSHFQQQESMQQERPVEKSSLFNDILAILIFLVIIAALIGAWILFSRKFG